MRLKNQKGFTLVEIVVVLVVLVTLTSSVVVSMDLTGHRAAVASQQLAADLRYAQQLANARRVRHGVEVSSATSYRVFVDDGGAGTTVTSPMTGNPYIVNMSGDFNGVTLGSTLGGTPPKAQFDSVGRPFDGNSTAIGAGINTINLLAAGAVVSTVSVEPNTGMVQVN